MRTAVIVFHLLSYVTTAHALELTTAYTTIIYENEDLLRKFNRGISLGSLSFMLRNKKSVTPEDEVKNKVDVVVERVENILDMRPRDLKFRIALLASDNDVQKIYETRHAKKVDYIAFYSPRDNTIYLSVDDISIRVLAHEMAHVVINRYFGVQPSARIHEVLAQFVESHLKD